MNESRLRGLLDCWEELKDRERTVLMSVAKRLVVGQRVYGGLYPHKKDWKKEAYEEALDMCVYLTCGLADVTED